MTQYRPIRSRTELHNPRDGPTPENTKPQNWRCNKIIFPKKHYNFNSEYFYYEGAWSKIGKLSGRFPDCIVDGYHRIHGD